MGYRAFKIHGWHEGNAKEEAELVLHVRKMVGDEMALMLDPACELRTFADALYVGRACDEANYFWLEDPYRDSGVSAFAHNRLRGMLKTPLLQTEHIRGVEPKADFLIAGGTDFLRSDPEYDMGITGCQKIHHMAESLGVDVEVHACGPAHRHLIAASRNSNFYEVALVGPDCPNAIAPVYSCDYSDQLDCIDADGMVSAPKGVGLGCPMTAGLYSCSPHCPFSVWLGCSMSDTQRPTIYIDADACPVKAEAEQVATRHNCPLILVTNGGIRPSQNPLVRLVIVDLGADNADKYIADPVSQDDIVVTNDIPLAARVIDKGAYALRHNGSLFTGDNIGLQLANRDLMADMRASNPFLIEQNRGRQEKFQRVR